jgi:LPS-assembly protein
MYFYAFTEDLIQKQIPIVHPVIDHDYTLPQPVLGGELNLRANLTSLSRDTASFDPISKAAIAGALCNLNADPMMKTATNCLLRGVPGVYSRFSAEANWKMTFIDSMGQVFTPFFSLRGDAATMKIDSQPGVSNYLQTGQSDLVRGMPTVGIEYRYPFISAHSWGTQTIEPIAQLIVRPDEPSIGRFPNEDAQTLLFDDTNIFRTNKFSGWDRLEGGTRVNYGLQYTAQVTRAGYFNVLVGQSFHLFGQNSFAVGGLTNTGLDSGLESARSDYVLRASYQPTAALMFTSRFRLDEQTLAIRRMEFESAVGFGRWSATVLYGYYDAQPNIGFLTPREGILATTRVKLTPNWQLLSAVRYDLRAEKISQTQIGIGYIDDCLILAVNYITDYAYSGSTTTNNTILFQLGLRTIGGTSVGTSTTALTTGFPGL